MGTMRLREYSMENKVYRILQDSIKVHQSLLGKVEIIELITKNFITTIENGNKILIFGNGGSAADAQHMAGEFINRFLMERFPLPAIALTTDTSVLTCIGNDVGFDEIFALQIQALTSPGDLVMAISTSGNSPNVIRGIEVARAKGNTTVGFTGQDGGVLRSVVDLCLCVPSNCTPRIQEAHITLIHIVCELLERSLFGE